MFQGGGYSFALPLTHFITIALGAITLVSVKVALTQTSIALPSPKSYNVPLQLYIGTTLDSFALPLPQLHYPCLSFKTCETLDSVLKCATLASSLLPLPNLHYHCLDYTTLASILLPLPLCVCTTYLPTSKLLPLHCIFALPLPHLHYPCLSSTTLASTPIPLTQYSNALPLLLCPPPPP